MTWIRYLPRFRQATAELKVLAEHEAWTRARIEEYQLQRVNALWQHAARHVPYYRQLAESRSLPERFESLAEYQAMMPVLSKSTVRNSPEAILAEQAAPGRWHVTGGSTGRPMRLYWEHEGYRAALRARYRFYASWDIDLFDRSVFLWGHEHKMERSWRAAGQRFKQWSSDWLRRRLRLSAYRLGRNDLQDHLRRIAAFQPAMVYGFSKAVHLLALESLATGFRCGSLRLVVLTSEVATPAMMATIEQAFGVPVVQEYGAAECPLIAGSGVDGMLRVREDAALVETARRDDGRYDVLLTVLHNPSFPLLRYAIEDVVDQPLELPERGFARLSPICGRNDDLILSVDDEPIHPTRLDAVFEHTAAIRRYRVHQNEDGVLSVQLETIEPLPAQHKARLAQELTELVGGWPVEVRIVDAIPLTMAGKHRPVTSDRAIGQQNHSTAAAGTT